MWSVFFRLIRLFFFVLAFVFFQYNNFAQSIGTLRGSVSDSLSGEALPFANILIENTSFGSAADSKGNFIIAGIPANKLYTVKVSFLGYKSQRYKITLVPDQITNLRAKLSLEAIKMQAIEKTGERYDKPNETDLSLQRISIREIEYLPQGVETDIFRSLQYLPGVKSTGDVSARYYVRGGNTNQNLVLFNGVSVYNPFHALGLFSIIDPETINALEFLKGGFSSEYGGRVSSILNLVTKDGNQNRFSANSTLSFLTVKASVEGPLPIGSFIISARKSTFNQTLKKFLNYKEAPFDFHDLSFKFNYSSSGDKGLTKLSVHGFNSLDRLLAEKPDDASYNWSNNIYGAYLFQEWEYVPIYSETNLSYSGFNGEVFQNQGFVKPRSNNVVDITLKSDVTYIDESRDEIKVGYSIKSVKTELKFENLMGAKTDLSKKALQLALYAKYRFLRWEDLGIDIGTRINGITLTKNYGSVFEPRINTTYRLFPWLAIKGAWGIFTQDLITLTNENEIISIFEPWVIIPDYLEPMESIHYVGGIEFDGIPDLSISIEGYYKILHNSAEINDRKIHSSDPDFIKGSGEAYGSEYLIRYISKDIQATASYSLSWTYKKIGEWISYPKYDIRHSASFNLTYNMGDDWQSSVSWFFNTGLPFTQILGYYDKLYLGDLYNLGSLYGNYTPYTILGDRNLGRLPTYHRLDLNLSKKFSFFFGDITLSFNLLNVYNRKNIFYFDRKTGKQVNMLPILPTATIKYEI